MYLRRAFDDFRNAVASASSLAELGAHLAEVIQVMGYDHFCLNHHVDQRLGLPGAIHLHNYPPHWVEFFKRYGLGACQLVQRAAERQSLGFSWADLDSLVMLNTDELQMIEAARDCGMRVGYTVPLLVPGDFFASCTFALRPENEARPVDNHLAALVAPVAFDHARRICGKAAPVITMPAHTITGRVRDAAVLVAMGKTNPEGGDILGISQNTFRGLVSENFQRLGVSDRTALAVRALRMGVLSYSEIRL